MGTADAYICCMLFSTNHGNTTQQKKNFVEIIPIYYQSCERRRQSMLVIAIKAKMNQ